MRGETLSATKLIREAQASGIELRLVDGKVKAFGPRDAVARLLVPLREQRAALAEALQSEPLKPSPSIFANTTPEPTDWHVLDAACMAHHFNCPTCIAADCCARYGLRCGTGAALWRAYLDK
ncbi:hypothetical protein [Rhodoferax antarcticus]|uniref:hypothetical protein n=1 Tax=Rhodoferax antarcticus TaxID=81479 RepID=UPI0022251E8F|nr:hypothetical protein [Rhodoferax antarcticus]MCW2313605.1 hypothetical protein [Rhodoferax antarcticus]